MADLFLAPDQAVSELILVAGLVRTKPNLLPWTAALADRCSLPIKLIYVEPAGTPGPSGSLDTQLETRLIALRAHLPELRIESRTVHISDPASAWTDDLRPHSLLIASFVPEMLGSLGTAVVVGPKATQTPGFEGQVVAVLDGLPETDRVVFAAESLGSTLGCPVRRIPPGDPYDPTGNGVCFAAASSRSSRLQPLLVRSAHPVLVVGS